jgi:hypothetical protein
MHVAPNYLPHTPRFGACQALARIFLQRIRCSRKGVSAWHDDGANCLRSVFGLFSGCFRVVCECHEMALFSNGTPNARTETKTDPRPVLGLPKGVTPSVRAIDSAWDPFCATFLNPRRRPSRTVPVKLPPSPVTQQFGMGPILGLRFLPTTSRSRRYGATLAPSPVERVLRRTP